MLRFSVFFLFLLSLSACSLMSKRECASADWSSIGLNDALSGFPSGLFAERASACASHHVAADEEAYRRGYSVGLIKYCTPASGLASGRNGVLYQKTCPKNEEPLFLKAYEAGSKEREARQALERAQARVDELTQALEQETDSGRRKDLRYDLKQADRQLKAAEKEWNTAREASESFETSEES
ncbi:DUF2799 domain-containing protein [Coralliovum pocilloporae]|uniref:DUF2799 domain-containing protein n=1 Tax=Coralliovum pocilloporae TaxID=3066369 RepID=UPI003306B1B8